MVRSPRVFLLLSVCLVSLPAAAAGYFTITSSSPKPIFEGPSAVAQATVTRSDATGTVSIRYATEDGSGVSDTHYRAVAGTLTFTPGETVKTVEVPILNDPREWGERWFYLKFFEPVGAVINGTSSLTFYTVKDHPMPEISVPYPDIGENGSGLQEYPLYVRLSGPTRQTVSVHWAITPSTGFPNEGTLVFPPAETSQSITIRWTGDELPTPPRTFWLTFSEVQNATARDVQLTLHDDDRARMTFEDVLVTEPSGHAIVTVSLSRTGRPVTFNYSTINGTARAGMDYGAVSGTRTIPADQTSTTIWIPIYKDQEREGAESFELAISMAKYHDADLDRTNATITIVDEDMTPPRLTMDDWSGRETESRATFVLRMPTTTYQDVSVVATTSAITATQGADYVGKAQTLVIPAGSTVAEFSVDLLNDTLAEEVETFRVELSSPTNAMLTDEPFATGSIHDDDSPNATPSAFAESASVLEGHSGKTILPVRVWLDRPPVAPVELEYETENLSALAGSDYVATTGTLQFAVGETEKLISVPVNGDTVVEPNETFLVWIKASKNVLVGWAEAACVIVNDDGVTLPTVSIRDAALLEGNIGVRTVELRVELSTASTTPVEVKYETAGGIAQSGVDFESTTGTLTFNPGTTVKPIWIGIIGDMQFEPEETFLVKLITATGATVLDGSATCTIMNDDPPPPSRRRTTRH